MQLKIDVYLSCLTWRRCMKNRKASSVNADIAEWLPFQLALPLKIRRWTPININLNLLWISYAGRTHAGRVFFRKPNFILFSLSVTISKEHSPPWGYDTIPAVEVILPFLWNSKVRSRVHKNSPLELVQRQLNPVHISFRLTLMFSHLSEFFVAGFPAKITVYC